MLFFRVSVSILHMNPNLFPFGFCTIIGKILTYFIIYSLIVMIVFSASAQYYHAIVILYCLLNLVLVKYSDVISNSL